MVRSGSDADPARLVRPLSGAGPGSEARARSRATLLAVCLAAAVLIVNVTAPIVALAPIAEGADASYADLQWVLSIYALCLAVFQLPAGDLADLYGRRRIFLAGALLFLVASLLCTVAANATVLVAGRALQGIGAAAVTASSLAMLANEFEGRARSRAIGLWGGTLALSFAAGPVLGGALTDLLGWRAIFASGIPPLAATVVLVTARVRESRDPAADQPDIPGMVTLGAGMFALMFAVLRGNALGWDSALVIAAFALAALALVAFAAVERRQPAPMLAPGLFRIPTFNGASLLVALMAIANFGAFVYISYYLLVAEQHGPIEVGLILAPAALTTAFVSAVGGHVLHNVPLAARFALGQTTLAAGLFWLGAIDSPDSASQLIPPLVLTGVGVGFTNPLSAQAHLAVLPPEQAGLASGVNNTARQLGVALGIAVMGALLQARVGAELAGSAVIERLSSPADRPELLDRLAGPEPSSALSLVPEPARDALQAAYSDAYANGLADVLIVAGVIAALGIAVAATMIRSCDLYGAGEVSPAVPP